MAPDANIAYSAGNGTVTGSALLDSLDQIVSHHSADVVTSSWFEGFFPDIPAQLIQSWETELSRAAVEGISVNFASGDAQDFGALQYPGAEPLLTSVGGTSLAIGSKNNYLFETPWDNEGAQLNKAGDAWDPSPPGQFDSGTTGGISTFAEPAYQNGVVSGNVVNGVAKRAVPDVATLGDWYLGYQIGLTDQPGGTYVESMNGGTSLSSPLFAGIEADALQARHGVALGFANEALYGLASSAAFHDVTPTPNGAGYTLAYVSQGDLTNDQPYLVTSGQCSAAPSPVTCGAGYDTATGLGSPTSRFFSLLAGEH
jgi:subtilase family serine protease